MTDDTFDITVSLPQELADIFASPEEAAAFAHRSLVLELLRDVQISQGKAARLLGITRREMIEMMGKHYIPSGPRTAEEVDREIAAARAMMRESRVRASD